MNSCAWNHDGAPAFIQACAELDLKGATPEYVERAVASMRMLTFYSDCKPVGAAVFHGDQVHVGVLPNVRGRWLNKSVLHEFRDALKNAHRALIATTNEVTRRFAERLGWKAAGKEGNYVIYTP